MVAEDFATGVAGRDGVAGRRRLEGRRAADDAACTQAEAEGSEGDTLQKALSPVLVGVMLEMAVPTVNVNGEPV